MLDKAYNPAEHEEEIYKLWESSGAFSPKIDPDKKPFAISMPPPNVTGKLHIGHALFELITVGVFNLQLLLLVTQPVNLIADFLIIRIESSQFHKFCLQFFQPLIDIR